MPRVETTSNSSNGKPFKLSDIPGMREAWDKLHGRKKTGDVAIDMEREIVPKAQKKKGVKNKSKKKKLSVKSVKDVMEIVGTVTFLVPDYVPKGMLTMVFAPPGMGKSVFALFALIRPVIVGGLKWFNGTKGPAKWGYAMLLDTEGCGAITSKRVKEMGLPAERIIVPFDDALQSIDLTNAEHIKRIEKVIVEYEIKLAVLDSLRGSHPGDENSSKSAQVLKTLAEMAERLNIAIVIIHHTRKLRADEELTADHARGSNGFIALCRSQLGIEQPDPHSEWKRLGMFKENLGLRPDPIGFCIRSKGLMFGVAPEKPVKPKRETGKDRAVKWLETRMNKPGKWYILHFLKKLPNFP